MSVVKYKVGETVYYYFGGEIVRTSIVSCIKDDEVSFNEYVVKEPSGHIRAESQLFPTVQEAVEECRRSLLDRIALYEGLKEDVVADLTKLQKEHGC